MWNYHENIYQLLEASEKSHRLVDINMQWKCAILHLSAFASRKRREHHIQSKALLFLIAAIAYFRI